MNKWRAIVFDLDDTLYPEKAHVLSGFRAVSAWAAERLGISPGEGFAQLERLFEQGVRGDTFNRWLAMHDLEKGDLVQQLVRVYREHEPVLDPFPETPELLEALHQRYLLGLLSDGYLAVQQRKLAALSLAHHFDAIVFSDEWGRKAWKPSIKPFEAILERLRVDAAGTVYVADNPSKDFLGARQVGMSTIWVHRPDGEYAHLDPPTIRHAPDATINSLNQLERALVALETKESV